MKAIAFLVVMVGSISSSALAEDAVAADSTKLNGTWQVSYSIEPGARKTELKTVTIEDGELLMNGRKFIISLNSKKSPREIDLKDAEAEFRVYRGIYELDLDDDQLRISFAHWDRAADSPNARPRTFNSENPDFFHLKLLKSP